METIRIFGKTYLSEEGAFAYVDGWIKNVVSIERCAEDPAFIKIESSDGKINFCYFNKLSFKFTQS